MLITVNRFKSDEDTTISQISVDGQFVCFGLEDEYRAEKVANEARIKAGRYKIGVRREGRLHSRYQGRYPEFHRGMLHVLDVPEFEFILIHTGNTDEDTSGCLLVGTNANTDEGDMRVTSSRQAYRKLYPMVIDAAEQGELEIEYVDND